MPDKTPWTPGPWRMEVEPAEGMIDESFHVRAKRPDEDWREVDEEGKGEQIITCIPVEDWIEPHYSREREIDRANARLIAAAPDLYEALELVEEWWLEQGMQNQWGAPACIFKVREVLVKANPQRTSEGANPRREDPDQNTRWDGGQG